MFCASFFCLIKTVGFRLYAICLALRLRFPKSYTFGSVLTLFTNIFRHIINHLRSVIPLQSICGNISHWFDVFRDYLIPVTPVSTPLQEPHISYKVFHIINHPFAISLASFKHHRGIQPVIVRLVSLTGVVRWLSGSPLLPASETPRACCRRPMPSFVLGAIAQSSYWTFGCWGA